MADRENRFPRFIGLRVSEEMLTRLRREAQAVDRSVSQILRRVVADWLAKRQ